METKRNVILIGIITILLIIAMGVLSYGAFNYSKAGERVNTIVTGTVSMSYQESSNIITITDALPMSDSTGKLMLGTGEYFDFSITTNLSDSSIMNWEIAAEDLADSTFNGNNIKYYLTKVDNSGQETEVMAPKIYNETSANEITGKPDNMMSLLTGSTNTQGSQTTNYRLRIWISDTYNPQGQLAGLIYKTRINVYGKIAV